MRALFFLCLCLGISAPARAHKLTVSVLSLEEIRPGEYLTSWQRLQGVPDARAAYLLLRPVFPQHCRFAPPRLDCGAEGLTGRLGFSGLGDLSSSAVMQISRLDRPTASYAFSTSEPQIMLRPEARVSGHWDLVKSFVAVGVEHILLGWDHLAFVLGLLWLVRGRLALIKTITAFTVGHSITLTAAALGYTELPAAPVEAVIALSIAFVAAEARAMAGDNDAQVEDPETQRERSLARRAPWLVASGFGLLHGLGFANALREAEINRSELPYALLGFNVGVELGQLAFVASVLFVSAALVRVVGDRSRYLAPVAHYFVGGLAMYWFIERVWLFAKI